MSEFDDVIVGNASLNCVHKYVELKLTYLD